MTNFIREYSVDWIVSFENISRKHFKYLCWLEATENKAEKGDNFLTLRGWNFIERCIIR